MNTAIIDDLARREAARRRRALRARSRLTVRWHLWIAQRLHEQALEELLRAWAAPAVGGYPVKRRG